MIRAYMAHGGDPDEGALLVITSNGKMAKKLVWPYAYGTICNEYTDLRVRLVRNQRSAFALADLDKLSRLEPHVVDSPASCDNCGLWGLLPLSEGGTCPGCGAKPGERVARAITAYAAWLTEQSEETLTALGI